MNNFLLTKSMYENLDLECKRYGHFTKSGPKNSKNMRIKTQILSKILKDFLQTRPKIFQNYLFFLVF